MIMFLVFVFAAMTQLGLQEPLPKKIDELGKSLKAGRCVFLERRNASEFWWRMELG